MDDLGGPIVGEVFESLELDHEAEALFVHGSAERVFRLPGA